MSFGYLLAWMILFSSGAVLVQTIRYEPRHNRGWIAVHLLIVVATLFLISTDRDWSGYVAAEIWLLIVILPTVAYRKMLALTLDGELKRARRVSYLASALHPVDGWRQFPTILGALQRDESLERFRASGNPLARIAIAQRLTLAGRWEELVAWVRELGLRDFRASATLLGYYLRALGECGEINGLVDTFARSASWLDTVGTGIAGQCRLFLYAFTGRLPEVDFLVASSLAHYPYDVIAFWRATALMTAGDGPAARDALAMLEASPATMASARTRRAIERRLAFPLPVAADALTPESRGELARLTADWASERKYRAAVDVRAGGSYATYGIIAVNCLVFLVEIRLGGSTDLDVLYRMGALTFEPGLWPEFWRLLAANFLHHGWQHLVTNMLGLYFLGPFVERALGHFKFVVLYIGAGLLGMMLVSLIVNPDHVQILVGASGAVMALAGATAAVLLRVWRHSKNRVAERRFRFALLVVAMQSIFDLWTPEVSMTAHLSGAACGFVLALAMRPSKELI